MSKERYMSSSIYNKYIIRFDVNLLDCKFLGRGHNGAVYLLPEGKVIKICFDERSCKKEYDILQRIKENKYFPKVYGMCGNYMVRDYVSGEILTHYIKKHGLERELAVKIIELLEEFRRLGFKKMDIRCKDIMVQEDRSLKVIDPKKCYSKERDFPRHLSKGLNKLGVLEDFLEVVKEKRPNVHKKWSVQIKKYMEEINNHD
jgi:RIO-like serine/threonine protein kinase